jgi:predicted transcriptional regulator
MVIMVQKGRIDMAEKEQADQKTGKPDYFYFDLSDESHEHLLEAELQEAKENPLEPLNEVTKVEY